MRKTIHFSPCECASRIADSAGAIVSAQNVEIATEEAIVNAIVAAKDMTGNEGHVARALPHEVLVELLKRYNRYSPPN